MSGLVHSRMRLLAVSEWAILFPSHAFTWELFLLQAYLPLPPPLHVHTVYLREPMTDISWDSATRQRYNQYFEVSDFFFFLTPLQWWSPAFANPSCICWKILHKWHLIELPVSWSNAIAVGVASVETLGLFILDALWAYSYCLAVL